MAGVGLLNIENIETKFPQLRYMDLRGNRIFSVDAVDQLFHLKKLHTVNFDNNPIMIHIHFMQLVQDAAPQVEVINNVRVKEVGSKTLLKIEKLK